ncbi:MAG: hypothetical protein E2O78_07485 [Caldithrix sp.]|nr:MAG: hypothetical protein E2O78_07485 [Caldithrix sp.]
MFAGLSDKPLIGVPEGLELFACPAKDCNPVVATEYMLRLPAKRLLSKIIIEASDCTARPPAVPQQR